MIGQFLLNLLFAAALVSTGAYGMALRRGAQPRARAEYQAVGRLLFRLVFGGMLIASAIQLYNILTHNFQYSYVWGHSSRELSTPLLVATFYAGQEGSFMLWTLLTALIGVLLLPYIRKHDYEAEVMTFYGLIVAFLLLVLVAKSPFALVWETFAKDGVPQGFIPPNGKGLNPLLHNLWITIHPPILFAGFAAMSVPFAFAVAALIKRDYQQWIHIALPWVLFGGAVLGFGIMLGGFWAYETLGWGGFWGWDPVENSSLIPWLVTVALAHTMLAQKKTQGLVKTNLTLAVLCFLLVLYSTFLTRSGVLGDTSVHSFVAPGFFIYALLVAFMVVFGALGLGMILWRRKDVMAPKAHFSPTSREFSLAIGAALVMASAIIVVIGTSWPLACELLNKPKVAVDIAFYNTMHLPLAVIVALLNGAALYLRWRGTDGRSFARKLTIPLALAFAATAAAAFAGARDAAYAGLMFASFFALFANGEFTLRLLKARPAHSGAYLAHMGVALLFLGVVATSRYSLTEHARLPQGVAQNALGYKLTFLGREQVEKKYADREKYNYFVAVERDGKQVATVAPVLYWSDFNKRQSPFLEPGIKWGIASDIYVSPKGIETEGEAPTATISKSAATPLPLDSSYAIKLLSFDMSAAKDPSQNSNPEALKIGVAIEITRNGDTTSHKIFTTFLNKEGIAGDPAGQRQEPLQIPGTSYYLALRRIVPNKENLSQSTALLAFADSSKPQTQPREVFTVEISYKPFIALVWAGVLLIAAGFGASMIRRSVELRAAQTPSKPTARNGSPAATTATTTTSAATSAAEAGQ